MYSWLFTFFQELRLKEAFFSVQNRGNNVTDPCQTESFLSQAVFAHSTVLEAQLAEIIVW